MGISLLARPGQGSGAVVSRFREFQAQLRLATRGSESLLTGSMNSFDIHQRAFISLRSGRRATVSPNVMAALRDLEDLADT